MNTWPAKVYWAFSGVLLRLDTALVVSMGKALLLAGITIILYASRKHVTRPECPWIAVAAGLAPTCLLLSEYAAWHDRGVSYSSSLLYVIVLFTLLCLAGTAGTVSAPSGGRSTS